MLPRIALNSAYLTRKYDEGWSSSVKAEYSDAILEAGGAPLILPVMDTDQADTLRVILKQMDGLLLIGGHDLSAKRYGMEQSPKAEVLHPRREEFDFLLLEESLALGLPILGICLGCQLINVYYGGTLYQHLPEDRPESKVAHKGAKGYTSHQVDVKPNTLLSRVFGDGRLPVNSGHHQGIRDVGKGLAASAICEDGLTEAIEDPARDFLVGVEWHPEAMMDDPKQLALFQAFINAAKTKG